MSDIVHYEVYVYQNNSWDLLGRYPSEQRSKAMEYAKEIETSEKKAVKVARETYDLNTQTFQEALVYLSELPKQQPKKPSPYANSSVPVAIRQNTSKNVRLTEGVMMIFLAVLFSMVVAGVLTALTIRGMSTLGFMSQDLTGKFIIGTFIFFFLIISIPTSIKWVNWDNMLGVDNKQKATTKTLRPALGKISYSNKALYEMEDEDGETEEDEEEVSLKAGVIEKILDAFDIMTGRKPLPQNKKKKRSDDAEAQERKKAKEKEEKRLKEEQEERKKQEEEKAAEEKRRQEEEEKRLQKEKEEEELKRAEAETEELLELSNTDQDEDPPISKSAGHTVIPAELEKDYRTMTTFLSIVLRVLQGKNILLNTYARFGIELFLAGACEQLSNVNSLYQNEEKTILSGLLELLGRDPALADLFYEKIDEYMLEPKYLPVIKNGSKGIDIYLNNKSSPELISLIHSTMDMWLNSDKKELMASGVYTIMFTDIVSSTQMTQMLGDKLAQQLIHRHNTIVRQALNTCGGEEIKQTGDGIMASFLWASNAIDAAIAIQKAIKAYNRDSPTVPLEVRIGLNSGEPIIENNDMFGLTVQMASRVCSQADRNQIYVSSVVKELSAGKKYTFKELGEFELKGIEAPQTLYEVIWDQDKPKKPVTRKKRQERLEEAPKEVALSEALPKF